MPQFQPGEQAYLRIVFQNVLPIDDVQIVFVHEEDENEHILFSAAGKYSDKPLAPSEETKLYFEEAIPKDLKPGVYSLDTINFKTFSGQTLDYRGDIGTPKFEVIPEREFAPLVEDVSIFHSFSLPDDFPQ